MTLTSETYEAREVSDELPKIRTASHPTDAGAHLMQTHVPWGPGTAAWPYVSDTKLDVGRPICIGPSHCSDGGLDHSHPMRTLA